MRTVVTAASLAHLITAASAFVHQRASVRPTSSLFSLATPPPASARDEFSSVGTILEGGKVIDFQSVSGPSQAEQALADAKKVISQQLSRGELKRDSAADAILGINQDVINEVGHELSAFASPAQIQDCAKYLRNKAPEGLFRTAGDDKPMAVRFTQAEIDKHESILNKAYLESGEVTSAFAKTFYMGTQLLPKASQQAIWAIYVWCRRTDEIVDAPRENDDDMLTDLGWWEIRLERLWEYGEVVDAFDLCLLDVLVKYPTLPLEPFMDMVRGMLMDVPGLGQEIYQTFDELHLYCYRVAGTVGLMSLPVFGCAPGYDFETSKEPALSLGVAFQLTNILRDVGEDAVQRGRIYLPREDMERFGVTEDQIRNQIVNKNYIDMMKFQISRARMYYARARRGVFMLAPESRLPVQSSLDAYGRILDKIEENGYDSLTTRAYVDKWEKLSIIPFSWYRTLDVSKFVPLPGDSPMNHEA